MTSLETSFREVIQAPTSTAPALVNRQGWTHTLYTRLTASVYGWALVIGLVTWVFLYVINPPLVQQSTSDTNDLTRPPPNLTTITLLSLGASVALILWQRGSA